ncbi:MAG: zf-HC2 domain-containing protein [Methylococcaceae bacterium]|nr:zf-HC2 domain-containing protein [Methylococcaceae bacterium]
MLTCKEASRLLSQSMDQPLPRLKRMELRVHVWMCSACSNVEKQLLFLRRAAQQLDDGETRTNQVGLSREARERIRKAVRR